MAIKALQKKTILFSGHDFRFLRPLINYCERSPQYDVLLEEHSGHVIKDTTQCERLIPRADVIFCEWCLGNAVWYSQHKRVGQKLIVRLHLQEMRLPFLDQVAWDKVDALVLICPLNFERIKRLYPSLNGKAILIYNPIDCSAFDQEKLFGAEFNLGLMGICPMRKAPHLAIKILKRLKQIDRRYTLFIKGNPPSEYEWLWKQAAERKYYEELYRDINSFQYKNSIIFEPYDNSVSAWFSKIGFILSTSDFEGSHQSVAEGMASGAIPIIRNWEGAELLYPGRSIFKSVDEVLELITRLKSQDNYSLESGMVKEYARTHFDQEIIIKRYEELISEVYRSAYRAKGGENNERYSLNLQQSLASAG